MNMTEKNGQPSMEEILASIRRIIAEEPATQAHGDFRGGQPIMLRGDGVLDDAGDFDLPAIFRSSSTTSVPERPTPLLGRLTDAIRSATSTQSDGSSNGEDLEVAEANGSAHEPIQDYSLSSLRPVRTIGHDANGHREAASSSNGARPINGSGGANGHGLNGNGNGNNGHGLNGHAVNGHALNGHTLNGHALNGRGVNGHGHHAETGVVPLNASASNSGDEPKRVMASFKDTKFMRMTSAPAEAAPIAAPEVTAAPAPIEMPFVDPVAQAPVYEAEEHAPAALALDLASDAVEVPVQQQPALVAMPPPPLPDAGLAGDAAEGVGSIEDTTADLLRPMLRQWLADNMPRMVEKALHIEIAESVKPIKKP